MAAPIFCDVVFGRYLFLLSLAKYVFVIKGRSDACLLGLAKTLKPKLKTFDFLWINLAYAK